MILDLERELLAAIAEHGPLSFAEAMRATRTDWAAVNHALRHLERTGHVVILADERARLTVLGRREAGGVQS